MLNSMEQTLEVEDDNNNNRGSEPNPNQSQEWETMARLCFSAFCWSESDLVDRLLSIQNYMRLPITVSRYLTLSSSSSNHYEPSGCHFFPHQAPETYQVGASHARFQRTDQWLPVYSWLESLDKDEGVQSTDNPTSPKVQENVEVKETSSKYSGNGRILHFAHLFGCQAIP
ncbi:hypothetical protein OIU79_029513 [Salix purpurea]|uniref:Uncharacterized protein n=1 Tax=Salix purpurea TaxID=77065 RepID=A0A9Q0ZVF8_SALPP|nr:hypothetical protein OIU79_029513 [Salix purpurea]